MKLHELLYEYKKNKLQFSLMIYIMINILYLLFGFICARYSFDTFLEGYKYFSYGLTLFFVLNYIWIIVLVCNKKYKFKIIDFLIICITIFLCISLHFSYNYKCALNGFGIRFEGFYQILYYLTILILSTFLEDKNKDKIIYVILFSGIFQVLYSIVQINDLFPQLEITGRGMKEAKGLTTNPNFLGTYMLICLLFSIGLFYKNKKNKFIYIALIFVFIVGLLLSNALSCIIGLIGALFLLLIYSLKNKNVKNFLVILLIFILTLIPITKLNMSSAIKDLLKTNSEIKEIAKGNMSNSYGTNRLYIWKNTIKIVPKYIIHGVGIDNFYYAFNGKPLTYYHHTVAYDKTHNEYLQILITEGIFSLICYLLLFIYIIISGFKNKNILLLLPVIGYLIQAFFNISVIEVAPLFYISCGLLINRENKEVINEN